MIKFNIKIPTDSLEKAKKETQDRYRKVLMKAMFKMESIAIRKAPVDRGLLKEQITVFPEILADRYVLKSGAPYSADLEYGNRPHYVPFKPILDWVKRKNIRYQESGQIAFAKYVQEKIKKEGVNAQPFFRPALIEVKTFWLPQFMAEAFE